LGRGGVAETICVGKMVRKGRLEIMVNREEGLMVIYAGEWADSLNRKTCS
jgi:hypothetical protein